MARPYGWNHPAAVSIVICTDGRAQAIENTLRCLRYLDGPDFEVVVVIGPTQDGTHEVVARWADAIRILHNPRRNLSVSRNIGIRAAAGDIITFIDDDCLPEPAWLEQIIAAFDDPKVGAAGGIVLDHTGCQPQYLYAACDRLGNPDWNRRTPADAYNFPYSFNFPYLQGTNSAFRRNALVGVDGFDEEYEYYLDETDLCCRLVDDGWIIRQLPDAYVHHKILASSIRNADRVTRVFYPILKNKLYFSLVNNKGHYSVQRAADDMNAFVASQASELQKLVDVGRLDSEDLRRYRQDVDRAWKDGLERGLQGRSSMLDPATIPGERVLKVFPRPVPEGGRSRFVFCSRDYPPGRTGGVARYTHQIARSVAALGHHVHVLAADEGHDRIDFEDNVWVHRLAPVSEGAPPQPAGLEVPGGLWAHSSRLLQEVRSLRGVPVTAVCTPIWDCEGISFLADGRIPHAVVLQTPMHSWLETHPHMHQDESFMASHGRPVLAVERRLLEGADGIVAISRAIAKEITEAYGVPLVGERLSYIPLGLDDWTAWHVISPPALPQGALRMLFVGRLETRKGIDVLLEAAKHLLMRHPHVHLDVVGNAQIPGPGGVTYRDAFLADPAAASVVDRVHFRGEVDDATLRGYYRACDVLVTPSRFESFGLMLVEGMMFGKPVIGCRAGGMIEVIEDGVSGLLAEPGDPTSLSRCIERVLSDAALRERLGTAGRARFEALFRAERTAREIIMFLRHVSVMHETSRAERGAAA